MTKRSQLELEANQEQVVASGSLSNVATDRAR